jgi:hypothetical protein
VLVVGTPDYGSWKWPAIERLYRILLPGGYADEHIHRYTRDGLLNELSGLGLRVTAETTILGGELIVKAVKGGDS